jgi:hypothetical protein
MLQVAYMVLQVCILSMLVIRLIEGTAFQPKLGIIAKAIRKMIPELMHLIGPRQDAGLLDDCFCAVKLTRSCTRRRVRAHRGDVCRAVPQPVWPTV